MSPVLANVAFWKLPSCNWFSRSMNDASTCRVPPAVIGDGVGTAMFEGPTNATYGASIRTVGVLMLEIPESDEGSDVAPAASATIFDALTITALPRDRFTSPANATGTGCWLPGGGPMSTSVVMPEPSRRS